MIDVGMGGFTYWALGFGLIHGTHPFSTSVYGVGHFFFDPEINEYGTGELQLKFFYNVALATSCTSIISGGMAER